jgi:hypothetical protein
MCVAPSRHTSPSVLLFVFWLTVAALLPSPPAHSQSAQELRIDPSEIVTLLPKDAIPAIRAPAPLLVPAAAAHAVRDNDQVLGVTIGAESRAYPVAFLSWHEIINDTIGGVPIAATW